MPNKLKLDLNTLVVESFVSSNDQIKGGTGAPGSRENCQPGGGNRSHGPREACTALCDYGRTEHYPGSCDNQNTGTEPGSN